ncbi:MAG: single-stranded-DNA-specific exonuclease RecJ [Pelolinea sp.]|nr:single-stranded-DNA-specific exonuclease RecJ [Pelolinea sp.]
MPMKWVEPRPVIPSDEIGEAFQTSLLVAEQLTKRGITTAQQARQFLDPTSFLQASPFDFPEMGKALERVQNAIKNKERIGIWGDFDVDGQTSTAILVDGLRKSGADIAFHIPVRARESHGIQLESLKRFLSESNPRLIITCDTGITEFESLEFLSSIGVDTIITDHHSPAEKLPSVYATINPRLLSDSHSFYPLAGVGTAFQLIRALFSLQEKDVLAKAYFDLVALGTIADLADLTGENRFYTKTGLRVMNDKPRKAFAIMAGLAGFRDNVINESHIGFTFAPRLNALGRLGDANPIVNFLLSNDEKAITETAKRLEELNTKRKLAVDMVYQSAVDLLEKKKELLQYPVIVLDREKWERGVVGIAASRLVEKYHKPAILLDSQGGIAAGSARSIEGINIIKAIQENSQYLIKYGGHPMAAGLSLAFENIPEFREGLSRSISRMSAGKELEKTLEIDAYLPLANINESLLNETEQLAPFGPGNPPPVLVSRNLEIEKTSYIGKSKEHRKLIVKDQQGNSKNVLWWESADSTLPDSQFDLAYYVRRDDYHSNDEVSLEWLDFREIETATIDLRPEIKKFKIHDFRAAPNQNEILEKLAKEPDLLLWAEGIKLDQFLICNRLEIIKAKALAVLVSPADREILKEVVKKADPTEIYLFNLSTIDDSVEIFTIRLIGLTKYCLSHKAGKTSLEQLGAALGQSNKTILLGLELLRAKGEIEFSLQGTDVELSRIKKPESPNTKSLETNLKNLLDETSAFRSYFRRIDPDYLFSDV